MLKPFLLMGRHNPFLLYYIRNRAAYSIPLCNTGPTLTWPGQELLSNLCYVGSNGWRQRYSVQGIPEGVSLLKV